MRNGAACARVCKASGLDVIRTHLNAGAACDERVFSLLKLMFGDAQMDSLADYIQAALMLRYNNRKVG